MAGKSFDWKKAQKQLKSSNGLRRGFAFALTMAMLYTNMVFAPVTVGAAENGVTPHYTFKAARTVAANEAELGSNVTIGRNITRTSDGSACKITVTVDENGKETSKQTLLGQYVKTDGWVAMADGTQTDIVTYNLTSSTGTAGNGVIDDPDDHYGVPFRLIRENPGDGDQVEEEEDNSDSDESGVTKVPTEMLEVYLNGMSDLDTTDVGAVNLSLLCGFFIPVHNHKNNTQSNESNIGVEKQLRAFVSLDGETYLRDSVGVRSSTLLGGGSLTKAGGWTGVYYRVETEDLLSIPGVAGNTIKNIKVMPFGESQRSSGRFCVSELVVNKFDSESIFEAQVRPDPLTYIPVGGDTLRQIAVQEAERTANAKWTTEAQVRTFLSSKRCDYLPTEPWNLETPIVHQGPTYEQSLDSTRELFFSQIEDIDPETGIGVWKGGQYERENGSVSGARTDAVYGMDCQTFVFNAVSRVSRSYAWSCVHTVNAPFTSLVGPHLNPVELPRHTDKDILNISEEQAVYESYALAGAGDITDSVGYGLGHTRLVKSVHTVYIPTEGGYFKEVSAPEYEYVGECEREYTLSGDFKQVAGGGYVKKENYVYVGEGKGTYNDCEYKISLTGGGYKKDGYRYFEVEQGLGSYNKVVDAEGKTTYQSVGAGKGNFNRVINYVWAGDGNGSYNKINGFVEVGKGFGSYNLEDKYVWVGEGKGDYAMEDGVYFRMPRVRGFRRGDYNRVKEGVYEWVGAGNGSFNIDPDQSSMTCVHQASIPNYFFGKPIYDEDGETITGYSDITNLSIYSTGYYPWDNNEDGEPDMVKIPKEISEGYELLYSCSSRDNSNHSFTSLKNTGYAIFTLDEYRTGQVEKENVQAVFGSLEDGKSFADAGAMMSISSNYRLISYEIDLVRLDYKGDPVPGKSLYSSGLQYIMESNIMTQTIRPAELNTVMAGLPNGKYRINLSVDSGPLTSLDRVDVPRTVLPFDFEISNRAIEAVAGDVFYIPTTCAAGQTVQAYVINSASGVNMVGDKVMVTIPEGTENANGETKFTLGRFWQVVSGTADNGTENLVFNNIRGIFGKGSASRFKFGYHDVITDIEGNTLHIDFAPGHTGANSKCGYKFNYSCGWDRVGSNSNLEGVECASTLTIPDVLPILDLRTDVLNKSVEPVDELAEVKELTDAGLAIINTYVADGANPSSTSSQNYRADASGTATVVIVIDPTSSFTATYPVSTEPTTNGEIQLNRNSGTAGTIVTVTDIPALGYELEAILVDGVEIPGNTFTIRGLHTVTARFKQSVYEVTVAQADNGTVSIETKDGIYTDKATGVYGDEVKVIATPNDHFELASILVDGNKLEGVSTFTMTNHHQVTAQFTPILYTVTVEEVTGGVVKVDKSSGAFGESVTITATANSGYELDTILLDGVPVTDKTFTIEGNHKVSAKFTKLASGVTVIQPIVGGTIKANRFSGENGDMVNVSVQPKEHYVLKAILVNGEELNGTQFALGSEETATVSAQFARVAQPGDVMYIPDEPGNGEYVEGYLVSSDTAKQKIFFYFEDGFKNHTAR